MAATLRAFANNICPLWMGYEQDATGADESEDELLSSDGVDADSTDSEGSDEEDERLPLAHVPTRPNTPHGRYFNRLDAAITDNDATPGGPGLGRMIIRGARHRGLALTAHCCN
jgi:hypothetical protein